MSSDSLITVRHRQIVSKTNIARRLQDRRQTHYDLLSIDDLKTEGRLTIMY